MVRMLLGMGPGQATFPELADPHPQVRGAAQFARSLWADDYAPFMEAERAEARESYMSLPQSRYRRRLKGAAAEIYDEKAASRLGRNAAVLARGLNTQAWTFTIIARSISYFCQRVPQRVLQDELDDRRIASQGTCNKILKQMVAVQPPVDFIAQGHVFVMGADQTYCWRGAKKRGAQHRGAGVQGFPFPL